VNGGHDYRGCYALGLRGFEIKHLDILVFKFTGYSLSITMPGAILTLLLFGYLLKLAGR